MSLGCNMVGISIWDMFVSDLQMLTNNLPLLQYDNFYSVVYMYIILVAILMQQ